MSEARRSKIVELRKSGKTVGQIAALFAIDQNTVYRVIREHVLGPICSACERSEPSVLDGLCDDCAEEIAHDQEIVWGCE